MMGAGNGVRHLIIKLPIHCIPSYMLKIMHNFKGLTIKLSLAIDFMDTTNRLCRMLLLPITRDDYSVIGVVA